MAVGTVSGISPDNWQLLQTLSPSGVNTITSSASLSGYKTIMCTFSLTCAVADRARFYFNGDTGNNYSSVVFNGTASATLTTAIETRAANSTTLQTGNAIIYYANIAAPKVVDICSNSAVGKASWLTASALSSITFITNAENFDGTIKIYGIAG